MLNRLAIADCHLRITRDGRPLIGLSRGRFCGLRYWWKVLVPILAFVTRACDNPAFERIGRYRHDGRGRIGELWRRGDLDFRRFAGNRVRHGRRDVGAQSIDL